MDNHLNEEIKIKLLCAKPHNVYPISPTWDDFLSYQDHLDNECQEILIVEDKKIYNKHDEIFQTYLSTSLLVRVLKELSEYKSSNEISFFYNQIFTIKVTLTKENLMHNFSASFLKEFLEKDLHKEARSILLKEALISFLSHQGKEYRLGYLISHFDSFYEELSISYARYVNNHSFASLKSKYLGKKTEYINKINSVFHDITIRVVGIPLGAWLIAAQVDKANGDVFIFMKNLLIVGIVILTYAIILLNFLGQNKTLNAIKNEYSEIFGQLKKDISLEDVDEKVVIEKKTKDIEKVLKDLDATAFWVSLKIYVVCIIIVFIAVFSIAMASFS